MTGKYHNHKLQTNPWYREEEQHNITRHQEDKQVIAKQTQMTRIWISQF